MNYRQLCYETLGENAFWMVNKKLAKHFKDIRIAVLVADLISREKYFHNKNMLDNESFFVTQAEIEETCVISPKVQTKLLGILQDEGLLQIEKRGVPCKNFYRLNHETILLILANDDSGEMLATTNGRSQLRPTGGHSYDQREMLATTNGSNPSNKNNSIKISNKNNNNTFVEETSTAQNEIIVYEQEHDLTNYFVKKHNEYTRSIGSSRKVQATKKNIADMKLFLERGGLKDGVTTEPPSPETVRKYIEWVFNGSGTEKRGDFCWANVIGSVASLRKHWPQIESMLYRKNTVITSFDELSQRIRNHEKMKGITK